jgi:protoporphyrinogen/coproporphyrinogen III oxidase
VTRIAIIGGGISGLTAAYEFELARKRGAPIDWHLYEASSHLGGIIQTTRHHTPEGEYILEGGPDAWVTEKPWARDLAIELGLEDQLIYSEDATRKTYILRNNELLPIPDHMRLMVPSDLTAIDNSPLFTPTAKAAYANELTRAAELRDAALDRPGNQHADESVASFVLRHFGEEVLTTLAAPLLSGVFGGDVHKLSVRAVMPQFVAMEREHGSLIAALQAANCARARRPPQPIFTTLRQGMASLTEALIATLPADRLHLDTTVHEIACDEGEWSIWLATSSEAREPSFPAAGSLSAKPSVRITPSDILDHILLATSLDETRRLLFKLDPVTTNLLPASGSAPSLLPTEASSAILVSFIWPAALAQTFTMQPGFGVLVAATSDPDPCALVPDPCLLAATFTNQKFPHRAPTNARIIRAFFGGPSAHTLSPQPDEAIAQAALTQLGQILGHLPNPTHTEVRRLPRSLPQYEVGHLDRIAQLESLIAQLPGLHLLGNSYRGVGLPDLIRDARKTATAILTAL